MSATRGLPSTALDDLHWLLTRTADRAEHARINALIGAVEAYQERVNVQLGSSYTIGFMTVLERERQRQHRSVTA